MIHYSQNDPRWADLIISGTSDLGDFGCFITSLSMLAYVTPGEALEIIRNGNGLSGDLVKSYEAATALGIEYNGKRLIGSIKNPQFVCIAEVDMSPSPGKQQHFVVWLGHKDQLQKDLIIDPWDGIKKPNPYHIVSWRLFVEKPQAIEGAIKDIQNYVETRLNQLR